MEKYGFVYIWYDRKRKMYYIGCHWGTEDDGYICSSRRMYAAYKRRSQDFTRKVLEKTSNINSIYIIEEKWLSLIKDEELGKKYYNLRKNRSKPWRHPKGFSLTEDHKEKIRRAHLGKKTDENTKKILSIAQKKAWAEGKYPRKFSDERKRIMSKAQKTRKTPVYKTPPGNKKGKSIGKLYTYSIKSPDDKIYVVNGLTVFCRNHNIQQPNLLRRGHSKGYTLLSKQKL